MNRLTFSTLPCDGWSVDQLLEACRCYGFSGIELREGEASILSIESNSEEIERISRRFKDAGVIITNIGSSICVKGQKKDEEKLDQIKQLASIAEVLGARGIRIFLGNFARRRDAKLESVSHTGIIDWIQRACDISAQHQTEIWIETHNEYATGEALRKLLDEVGKDNCGVIYDIIHPLEDGESPERTIDLLGKQCVHVHMKDGYPSRDPLEHDWLYTEIGKGEIPIGEIIKTLESSGYSGYYSLEWETKWRKELQIPGMEPERIFPLYVQQMQAFLNPKELNL